CRGQIIFEDRALGIINPPQNGERFLSVELDTEPPAHQGTNQGLYHSQAVEDGSLIEAGVELKIGKILLGKNPAVILVFGAGGNRMRRTRDAVPLEMLVPLWRNPNRRMIG